MKTKEFYEISKIIENEKADEMVRKIENNREDLHMKWSVGKLIQEMQEEPDYNPEIISKWSKNFTSKYGKNYNEFNLKLMQEFYNTFKNCPVISAQVSWPYILELLPIKDDNERNYYLNKIIKNKISLYSLYKEIKNDSFNKLSENSKKNIKLFDDILNFSLETGESTIVIEGMEEVMEAMRKNCESK